MSILIKGMRMPENCIKCPMQFGGMCYVMPAEVDESRVAPTVEDAWKQGKPDWCPLVEISEHIKQSELIRCKDCKHYEWMSNRIPEEQTWHCHCWDADTGKDDFCSYAERRSE